MATKVGNLKGPTGAKGATGSVGNFGNTGTQGPPGPTSVSTDANNTATLGSDSLPFVAIPPLADATQNGQLRQVSGNTTDFVDGTNHCSNLVTAETPVIQVIRQNSLNIVGNANFEIDQRRVGGAATTPVGGEVSILDRWRTGTYGPTNTWTAQQVANTTIDPLTGYIASTKALKLTIATRQTGGGVDPASLAFVYQTIEGSALRSIISGPHSLTLQIKGGGLGDYYSVFIRSGSNSPNYYSFTKLFRNGLGSGPNSDTFYFPNLPPFPTSAAPFSIQPGVLGALVGVCTMAGTNYLNTANDVWVNSGTAGYYGGPGMSSLFGTNAIGTTLTITYLQWEPGPYCTPFIELPFAENLLACQRYFCKSNPYGNLSPTANDYREVGFVMGSNVYCRMLVRWPTMMAIAPPTVQFWDNVPNLNYVYTDYQGSVPLASGGGPQMIDSAGFGTLILNAANPATTSIGLLGQWRADTGW